MQESFSGARTFSYPSLLAEKIEKHFLPPARKPRYTIATMQERYVKDFSGHFANDFSISRPAIPVSLIDFQLDDCWMRKCLKIGEEKVEFFYFTGGERAGEEEEEDIHDIDRYLAPEIFSGDHSFGF